MVRNDTPMSKTLAKNKPSSYITMWRKICFLKKIGNSAVINVAKNHEGFNHIPSEMTVKENFQCGINNYG